MRPTRGVGSMSPKLAGADALQIWQASQSRFWRTSRAGSAQDHQIWLPQRHWNSSFYGPELCETDSGHIFWPPPFALLPVSRPRYAMLLNQRSRINLFREGGCRRICGIPSPPPEYRTLCGVPAPCGTPNHVRYSGRRLGRRFPHKQATPTRCKPVRPEYVPHKARYTNEPPRY